jgi:hypothetical protein
MGRQFNAINVRQNSKLPENRSVAPAHSDVAPPTPQIGEFSMDHRMLSGRRCAAAALTLLLADEDSVSLAGAAMLISKPGTGKNDGKWVANSDWRSWASDMQTTALSIRAAAKAKDLTKFSAAADHLSEVCQSCHTKYRPQVPSDGVARYPFYPKRELAP